MENLRFLTNKDPVFLGLSPFDLTITGVVIFGSSFIMGSVAMFGVLPAPMSGRLMLAALPLGMYMVAKMIIV